MDAVYTSLFLFPFDIWCACSLYVVSFHLNMSENLLFKSTAKALLDRERRARSSDVSGMFSNTALTTDVSDGSRCS